MCVFACVCKRERERERLGFFSLSLFPLSSGEQSRAGLSERRTETQTCADQSTATPQRQERRRVCKEKTRERKKQAFFNISKLWWISYLHQKKYRRTKRNLLHSLEEHISIYFSFVFYLYTYFIILEDLQGVAGLFSFLQRKGGQREVRVLLKQSCLQWR